MIESVAVTGRTSQPFRKKLNPVWWLLNDGEQTVDQAPWYKSDYPWLIRYLFWNFLRNPMMNFRNYVIGVGDRNYKVLGKRPAMTIQRDDLCPPELGLQWSIIQLNCGIILPFFSYCGKRLVIQCGWQPFGFAEIKINWRKIPLQQGRINAGSIEQNYSQLATGSQGNNALRLASNTSIESRCSRVMSMSSIPRIRRSLRNGLMSK